MKTTTEFKNGWCLQFKRHLAARVGVLLLSLAAASSPAQTYTILHTFTGDGGAEPYGGLLLSGSLLYGTTDLGGAGDSGWGAVFKLNIDGSEFSILRQFAGDDGMNPEGTLVLSGDTLFGTTMGPGGGTIFKIGTNGMDFTNLFVFDLDDPNGTQLSAGLVMSGNTLYGVTGYGGISNCGTIFKLNTDGTGFTKLKDFIGSDGAHPFSKLVLSGTTLYGATYQGGDADNGTLFKIDTDGNGFAVLKKFTGEDGSNPSPGRLVLSGAVLYGTTQMGGSFDSGTVFKVNTDGSEFTVLREFTGFTGDGDAGSPTGDLILSDTTLYGTTQEGGAYGQGTVFQVNTDGSGYAVLKSFRNDDSDGGYPCAGLVLSGTTLYGTTPWGGSGSAGTLFRLSLLPSLPIILMAPQDQVVQFGSTADFTVDVVGSPPASYQWFVNGTNAIIDATNSILELTDVQSSAAYNVVASNTYGSVTSLVANLTVENPFVESVQPGSQSVNLRQTAQFSVVAGGTPPLAYQWRRDGTVLTGATNSSLTLTDAVAVDAGYYDVVVRNAYGSVTSTVAPLTVNLAVTDMTDPGFAAYYGSYYRGVYSVAVQADGKIVVGGAFILMQGIQQVGNFLVRLNTDGTLDDTFNPGSPGPVYALAVQADGKILVGGYFTAQEGQARHSLARFNGDGTLDSTFNPGANGYVYCLAVQPDGKIVIGGDFTTLSGQSCTNLGRLNPDGSLDMAFASGADGPVFCVALQADGSVLAGGDFITLCGAMRANVGRLNTNGTPDTGFNPGVSGTVRALAVQSDGRILVGGGFLTLGDQPRWFLCRLNADGTQDAGFNPGDLGSWVFCLAVQADGKILVGGTLSQFGVISRTGIARLNTDGTVDLTFDPQAIPDVYCLAVQTDGRILVGGVFDELDQSPCTDLGRLVMYGPPAITKPVPSQTAEVGDTVVLTLTSVGYPPPTCYWFFNGTNFIDYSTNCILELTNLLALQSFTYTVVVSNIAGVVTSAPANLNLILPVERRPVPGIEVTGEVGSLLNVDYANTLSPTTSWLPLATVSLTNTSQFCFDPSVPLPPERFYRVWQSGTPGVRPSLNLNFVPAITLTGSVNDSLRLDYINTIGPTDAWVTLDTVTLTNTSQLYFDVTAPGQPRRLYRIVPRP